MGGVLYRSDFLTYCRRNVVLRQIYFRIYSIGDLGYEFNWDVNLPCGILEAYLNQLYKEYPDIEFFVAIQTKRWVNHYESNKSAVK